MEFSFLLALGTRVVIMKHPILFAIGIKKSRVRGGTRIFIFAILFQGCLYLLNGAKQTEPNKKSI